MSNEELAKAQAAFNFIKCVRTGKSVYDTDEWDEEETTNGEEQFYNL